MKNTYFSGKTPYNSGSKPCARSTLPNPNNGTGNVKGYEWENKRIVIHGFTKQESDNYRK